MNQKAGRLPNCLAGQSQRRSTCWRGSLHPPVVSGRHGVATGIQMAMIFLCFLCWVPSVAAISPVRPPQAYETLIVDSRVPVLVGDDWVIMSQEEHQRFLRKRAESAVDEEAVTTTVAIEISTTIVSRTSSKTSTGAAAATRTAAASPLPSPFDQSIASNFSSNGNCESFINNLLANPTFKSCYPFSMLVQGSRSFFQAQRSLFSMTQVLDATCGADVTTCGKFLNTAAKNLTDSSNCATELSSQNSLVVQVYTGLKAFQPLYSASCLKDPDTSAYCFANAITNTSALSDVYLYYLPLNITYPDTSEPNCNTCTRNVMAIYQAATADRQSYIANTYPATAQEINTACGAKFVNATLPAPVASIANPLQQAPSLLLFSLLIMALSNWL